MNRSNKIKIDHIQGMQIRHFHLLQDWKIDLAHEKKLVLTTNL